MRTALHSVPYRMIGLVAAWTIAALILVSGVVIASSQLERAVLLSPAVRADSPLSAQQALSNHAAVRAYLIGSKATVPGATEPEVKHLHDVRRLAQVLVGIALLSLVAGVSLLRKLPDASYRRIARRVSISVLATIVVLGALALLTGFQSFFLDFHLLFFPHGNFIFPATSFLITTYPESFFARMALSTAALVGLLAIVVALLARPNEHTN